MRAGVWSVGEPLCSIKTTIQVGKEIFVVQAFSDGVSWPFGRCNINRFCRSMSKNIAVQVKSKLAILEFLSGN